MNFQARVARFVVKTGFCQQVAQDKAKLISPVFNLPEVKVIHSELAVLDFNITVHNWHI